LHAHAEPDLNRAALSATTHCLTGCAIGEILGMVIATAAGWGNAASILIAIVLAFFFGYLLTLWPVLRAGLSLRQATGVALAADTVSIAIMEAVDNGFILIVPGTLNAGLGDAKFWWSIIIGLAIAFAPAGAANRWLIAEARAMQSRTRTTSVTCATDVARSDMSTGLTQIHDRSDRLWKRGVTHMCVPLCGQLFARLAAKADPVPRDYVVGVPSRTARV
jgi:hypothetical protein